MPSPIPPLPPVTTATLPRRSNSSMAPLPPSVPLLRKRAHRLQYTVSRWSTSSCWAVRGLHQVVHAGLDLGGRGVFITDRQQDAEGAAAVGAGAFGPDAAAVAFDDVAGDVQSQAQS